MRRAPVARALWAAACAALALLALAGCSRKKTALKPNVPPVTRLFLDQAPDTMSYNFIMHWSGDDPDGDIAGFDTQLTSGHAAPSDTAWKFTALASGVVAPPIGDGVGSYTFYVRAVDKQGLRDPHPASLYLTLRNHRPAVAFYNLPRRSKGGTYHFLPAITLQWHISDPEGPKTVRAFHVWLDGSTFDTLMSAKDSTFTFRLENFGDASQARTRTAYVAAVDEAAAVSDTISYSWIVDAYTVTAGKRVLLVDDYNVDPRFTDNNTPMDDFYRAAASSFSGGNYTLLDIFEVEGVRFPQDISQLFRHFDVVIWFNEGGGRIPLLTTLNSAEAPLAGYLDHGGKFFLSHLSVVGQDTLLDHRFHRHYLGVDTTYCANDGGCNYTLRSSQLFHSGNPAAPGDSIALASGFGRDGDLFVAGDSTINEFYLTGADAGDDAHPAPHTGVVTKLLRSGGRCTFSSVPLYRMDRFGNAASVVQRLLQGLVAPGRPAFPRFAPGRR